MKEKRRGGGCVFASAGAMDPAQRRSHVPRGSMAHPVLDRSVAWAGASARGRAPLARRRPCQGKKKWGGAGPRRPSLALPPHAAHAGAAARAHTSAAPTPTHTRPGPGRVCALHIGGVCAEAGSLPRGGAGPVQKQKEGQERGPECTTPTRRARCSHPPMRGAGGGRRGPPPPGRPHAEADHLIGMPMVERAGWCGRRTSVQPPAFARPRSSSPRPARVCARPSHPAPGAPFRAPHPRADPPVGMGRHWCAPGAGGGRGVAGGAGGNGRGCDRAGEACDPSLSLLPKKNAPVRRIKSVRNGGAVCLVCLACFFSSPRPSRQAVCALSSGASRRPALSPLPLRSPHSARVCVSSPGRARARGGHPGTHALSLSPGTRTHAHMLVSVCARSRRAPARARHLSVPVPRRPRAALARTPPPPTPHSRRGDLLPPPPSQNLSC
jgi:hypothetical protein